MASKLVQVENYLAEILDDLYGEVVLFTGFRDAELASRIESEGGKVAKNWNRQVTVLIHKDGIKKTAKIAKAEQAGIWVGGLSDFIDRFRLHTSKTKTLIKKSGDIRYDDQWQGVLQTVSWHVSGESLDISDYEKMERFAKSVGIRNPEHPSTVDSKS